MTTKDSPAVSRRPLNLSHVIHSAVLCAKARHTPAASGRVVATVLFSSSSLWRNTCFLLLVNHGFRTASGYSDHRRCSLLQIINKTVAIGNDVQWWAASVCVCLKSTLTPGQLFYAAVNPQTSSSWSATHIAPAPTVLGHGFHPYIRHCCFVLSWSVILCKFCSLMR